jgi:hypothetical protein
MSYPEFRSQLDNVLRSKDPEAVRRFLVEQGQWDESPGNDVEHAMWMMIAGSPTLQSLHAEAQDWLMQHGYQAEAEMLRERTKAPPKSGPASSGAKGKARPNKPGVSGKHTSKQKPKTQQGR